MFDTILGVTACLMILIGFGGLMWQSQSWGKTPTLSQDTAPDQPSPFRNISTHQLSLRHFDPYLESSPLTYLSLHQLTVIFRDGKTKEYCCLTRSQAVGKVLDYLTTGASIIVSQGRFSRDLMLKLDACLSSSEVLQDNFETRLQMKPTTESSKPVIPLHEAPSVVPFPSKDQDSSQE